MTASALFIGARLVALLDDEGEPTEYREPLLLRAKSGRATNIPHRGRDPVPATRKGRRTDRHVWTGCDAHGITSDELDPPLARRALTAGEREARERGREIDAALEPIVRPRIAAHISACRQALDVIEAELDRMSETLSIEPAASTRASALWLLLGRCVGQQRAVLLLAEHGMAVEGRPLDRTIKEMTNLVKAIGADGPVAEKLGRQWLSDGESYVKAQAGRRGTVAAFKNTEKEAEAFRRLGLESLDEADRAVFNDLGRAAHGRRSSVLESYYAPTRQMARGARYPLLDQAIAVEWARMSGSS